MDMQVRFEFRHEIAEDVWEYRFSSQTPLDFVAGQYAKFWFVDEPSLGGRTFTLTSKPGDTTVTFIVRFPNPMSDYKQKLQTIPVGTKLRYEQPMGDAILPRNTSTPLIFIAQGIGIASYISMLRECQEKSLPFNITLFWAHRTSDATLKQCFEPFITNRTNVREYGSHARLSHEDILPVTSENALLYLSGSQKFVETIGVLLEAHGLLRERMIYDYYEGYTTL